MTDIINQQNSIWIQTQQTLVEEFEELQRTLDAELATLQHIGDDEEEEDAVIISLEPDGKGEDDKLNDLNLKSETPTDSAFNSDSPPPSPPSPLPLETETSETHLDIYPTKFTETSPGYHGNVTSSPGYHGNVTSSPGYPVNNIPLTISPPGYDQSVTLERDGYQGDSYQGDGYQGDDYLPGDNQPLIVGDNEYNMRPSAFTKFTRDPDMYHDNHHLHDNHHHQIYNTYHKQMCDNDSRMNSLSRDLTRDRVMSEGTLSRRQLLGSAIVSSTPYYNALSPPPCPQSRGYASSMPFLDATDKRPVRPHSPMSECSRTTNTSRISLTKRAIHNSRRHNSDEQSQIGDPIDLSRIMQILSTATDGKLISSAAGYLQHLTFNKDHMKHRIRDIGAIPVLVRLLQAEEVIILSVLGALRNLSFGQQHNLNKIAIKDAHGVPLLVQLLKTSQNFEIQELITGVFWNLSSSDHVKPQLLRQALEALVKSIVIPQSGWKGSQIRQEVNSSIQCTTVFRNATGCLRNLSSAGLEGRQAMRACYGLVDSLLFVLRSVQGKNDVDNKAVENSVCILRNLSYRLDSEVSPEHKYGQVEDWRSKGLGGGQFKRKETEMENIKKKKANKKHKGKENVTPLPEHTNGVGLLWQPNVVRVYLDLLLECSNPETLEAAAGALRNLTASVWEPAQFLRESIRKEKGLSVITSLLRMSNDTIVRSTAVCLVNLSQDPKNKELLGFNAMLDLVKRLPGSDGADGITDLTIGAVISAILELVTNSADIARLLKEHGGLSRLVEISRSTDVYSGQCVHVSNKVLSVCWEIRELRKIIKHQGWNISMVQRVPVPDHRTDGLEYDESRNQFTATYNEDRNPDRHTLSRDRHVGSPRQGDRRVLSPSGYDHNTHRAATIGRAAHDSNYHRIEDYEMSRGASLPARSLPPSHPLNSNYGVADSWV